jgi:hypothetical protein
MQQAEMTDLSARASKRCATSSAASTTAAFSPRRRRCRPAVRPPARRDAGGPAVLKDLRSRRHREPDARGMPAHPADQPRAAASSLAAADRCGTISTSWPAAAFLSSPASWPPAPMTSSSPSRKSANWIPPPAGASRRTATASSNPMSRWKKTATEWKIILNSDYIPRLRISNTYREMIAKGSLSKSERDYLRERMRSGKFLIDSIEQRQRTIERITREILKAQADFFEHGVSPSEAAHHDPDRRCRRGPRDDGEPRHREQIHQDPARRFRIQIFLHHRLSGRQRRLRLQYQREGDDRRSRSTWRTAPSRSAIRSSSPSCRKRASRSPAAPWPNTAKELGLLPSNLRRDYA